METGQNPTRADLEKALAIDPALPALGERLHGMQEVGGSIPHGSTNPAATRHARGRICAEPGADASPKQCTARLKPNPLTIYNKRELCCVLKGAIQAEDFQAQLDTCGCGTVGGEPNDNAIPRWGFGKPPAAVVCPSDDR